MNFAFSAEQEELRRGARRFFERYSTGVEVRAAMGSAAGWDPEVWRRVGEMGWPSLSVPEAYGGAGLGAVELAALLEEMGRALFCSPFFATVCLGAAALIAGGDEAQKREHLPGLAAGTTTATLVWRPGLTVKRGERGGEHRLRGAVSGVVDGHTAELLVIAARAENGTSDDGVSLFVARGDAAGVTRRALPTLDQTRRLAELRLDDVRVPAAARLGDEGAGAPILDEVLDRAAIALAAEQVGVAQRCLDLAVEHAKTRVQFGRPIGSFQAIKHRLADLLVLVESARSAAYHAACVAAGAVPDEERDLRAAASLARAWCSDASFACAADCIQVHGGMGFTWEHDAHLYFKRARASEVLLDDAAHHRERFARALGI